MNRSDSLRQGLAAVPVRPGEVAGHGRVPADRLLQAALARGRQRGLGYYAGWRPAVMARLCARALERGTEVEYVRAFVRAHGLTPDTPPLGVPGWPWPAEVRALGPLTVCLDGRPLRGSGKAQIRPLDLLAALVAFGGREVAIERIADALWPEAEGDTGRAAFDTTILRLRRLLGDAAVLTLDQGRLSLDPHRCWVDTWAVEALLGRLERHGDGDLATAEGWLDQLAHLYRGPLLAARSDAWAIAPRERLRRRVVAQFERMGRLLEARGDVEPALGWYLRGLAADELADGLYQGAARCHRTAGRERSARALVLQAQRIREATLSEGTGRGP
jgi:LuxR family maltose regulon positive regulatory protein